MAKKLKKPFFRCIFCGHVRERGIVVQANLGPQNGIALKVCKAAECKKAAAEGRFSVLAKS